MDFWKELQNFEHKIKSDVNQYNALLLRSQSECCASLIESSKYAMCMGRVNRAWTFLVLAQSYWKNVKK